MDSSWFNINIAQLHAYFNMECFNTASWNCSI